MRQNRMLSGAEAVELGFADRLLEPVEFVDESIAFALELAERPVERRQHRTGQRRRDVFRKARATAGRRGARRRARARTSRSS